MTSTRTFDLGERHIGLGHPIYVIAEAGVNHDGDVERAHLLVDIAASTGADAVKFQTFDPARLVAKTAPAAAYQTETVGATDQHSMLERLTLPTGAWRELVDHARQLGLQFLSTPFDHGSLDLLVDLGVPAIKLSSGDVTNHLLLRAVAQTGLPAVLSTGASTMDEVLKAVTVLRHGTDVALLHCVTSYPAPLDECNLRAIPALGATAQVVVGWSDHTIGNEAALLALALGATVFEKHLTYDPTAVGPDHRASAGPDEFTEYVALLRRGERAMGDGVKRPAPVEEPLRELVRRSLHAGRDLPAGHAISDDDLLALRPDEGIPADADIRGRRIRTQRRQGDLLSWDDLEAEAS